MMPILVLLVTLEGVPHFIAGLQLMERRGCAAAIPRFEMAVTIAPFFSRAWIELGICHGQLGNSTGKIDAFRRAVDADRSNFEAYKHLAMAYALTGNREAALLVAGRAEGVDAEKANALRMMLLAIIVNLASRD